MLLLNILLALAWISLTGQFTVVNFIIGFGLGFTLLWLTQRAMGDSRYFRKVPQVFGFLLFFLWELLLASVRSAYFVLAPRRKLRPGVIAIPLDLQGEVEIALLANLITLTPGSLSLDVSDDQRTLYLHAMHIEDVEKYRRSIKDGFERRVKEIFS
ncbi:MAG: Na+/H+ antiporter subunit E [Chloroflexota bacterium]